MDNLNKKVFGTLFFSLLATITGVGIVVPLLPVYAHDLGAKGLYIGLIFGAFSISRTALLPYFGRRSDIIGRKPYIVVGLFLYALISFAFIMSQNVNTLIALRFIQGAASAMIMPVVQAYIGDITPKSKEGFYMGLFNISTFMGLSIGPLIGGAIKDQFGLNSAFGCMGIMAAVGFVLCLALLPPTRSERVEHRTSAPPKWSILFKDNAVMAISFYRLCYMCCVGMIWGFLPVFADAEFSLDASQIGFLVMLGVFISGAMQTPMGFVADKVNKITMMLIGGLIIVVSLLFYGWAAGFWDLVTANILFGIGGGVSMAPLMALAVQIGNRNHSMGSVMSLVTMAHSLGMMGGSLLAGVMMDLVDLRQVFMFGSLIMAAGILIFSRYALSASSPHSAAIPN